MDSHAEFLRRVILEEDVVKAIRNGHYSEEVSEQDRVMLDYVGQVTADATKITPDHHQRLREVGFNDQAILQITLIASWFNYINRVADALGV